MASERRAFNTIVSYYQIVLVPVTFAVFLSHGRHGTGAL